MLQSNLFYWALMAFSGFLIVYLLLDNRGLKEYQRKHREEFDARIAQLTNGMAQLESDFQAKDLEIESLKNQLKPRLK